MKEERKSKKEDRSGRERGKYRLFFSHPPLPSPPPTARLHRRQYSQLSQVTKFPVWAKGSDCNNKVNDFPFVKFRNPPDKIDRLSNRVCTPYAHGPEL